MVMDHTPNHPKDDTEKFA